MFQTQVVEKIKTHILYSYSCHVWDNVEKYCRTRLATDDSILQHMHSACWL